MLLIPIYRYGRIEATFFILIPKVIILSLNKINLHSVVLLTMIKVSGLQPAASSIKIPLQKSFQGGTSVEILQDHNP